MKFKHSNNLNHADDKEKYESCILCGKKTNILKSDHIAYRKNYISGAGQLCSVCAYGLMAAEEGRYQ